MTPEQHAARAEELIAEAERLYQVCLVDYQTNINEDDHADLPHVPSADLAMLTATTQLAQAHATVALRRPAGTPSVPVYEDPDETLGPGDITHYGDGEPTYD